MAVSCGCRSLQGRRLHWQACLAAAWWRTQRLRRWAGGRTRCSRSLQGRRSRRAAWRARRCTGRPRHYRHNAPVPMCDIKTCNRGHAEYSLPGLPKKHSPGDMRNMSMLQCMQQQRQALHQTMGAKRVHGQGLRDAGLCRLLAPAPSRLAHAAACVAPGRCCLASPLVCLLEERAPIATALLACRSVCCRWTCCI